MQVKLTTALDEERDAKERIAQKAAAQAAGHEMTVRELTEALDLHRTELHDQLDEVTPCPSRADSLPICRPTA